MALDPPLSWAQVAAVAIAGGFTPAEAVIATSITEPESARIPNNVQQGQPYSTTGWGLWQITPGDSEPQYGVNDAMLNPLNNARAAHAKYRGAGGWYPWTTWTKGFNAPFIPAATAAVSAVTHLSLHDLHRLIDSAAAGSGAASWTPDAAAVRLDMNMKRLLVQIDKQLINQRMAYNRIGNKGWLP